jgi:hypothetical protein
VSGTPAGQDGANAGEPAGIVLPEPDYGPPPLPPGFPRWKHFGYDGWDINIPVDWDLGALEVNSRGGYFRLDDEFEPRLMVRWQPMSGKFDPEKAIERHFSKRLKAAEAEDNRLEPRVGAPLPGLRRALRGIEYKTYALQDGERRSVGLAAHCPQCERAFIVEMNTTEEGGAGERLIRRVLGSLSDHPAEGLARWEFFGLSLDLPATMRALSTTFNQGFVSLAAAERGLRADVARWSLANVHLASTDLPSLLRAYFLKKRNMPPVTTEDAVVQSHPGCLFHTRKRLLEPVRSLLRRSLRIRHPAYRTGLIWHCETSNRIVLFNMGSNKPADVGQARLMASRVRCCKVMY